jgi:hypothetical protein
VVHVVVVVMVVMMMMVMMMVHGRLGRHGSGSGGGAGGCFLGERVTSQAEREHGRGSDGLDHGKAFLCEGTRGFARIDNANRLNSI